MYLSRLSLAEKATDGPEFWRAFGSEYDLHRSVWRLFGAPASPERDFLYRLDSHEGRPQLWTLSERQPAATGSLWRVETREVAPALVEGDRLELSVRVNPTVTRAGKRHDVVMDWKQRSGWRTQPPDEREPESAMVQHALCEWLAARQERLGIVVRRLLAEGYRVWRFSKPGGKQVQLGVCDLTGLVEVRDPERFLAAWRGGLGAAKGFGCGLMLIRRGRV